MFCCSYVVLTFVYSLQRSPRRFVEVLMFCCSYVVLAFASVSFIYGFGVEVCSGHPTAVALFDRRC